MFQTIRHNLGTYTKEFCPLRKAFGLSMQSYHVVPSAISSLLQRCCPTEVLFAVVAVVVLSVQGQSFGAFSHIREEVAEVMPPFADCNSPRAIVGVVCISRAVASPHHSSPTVIGWTARTLPRGVSMLSELSAGAFALEATARGGVSVLECRSLDDTFLSTVTATPPIRFSLTRWRGSRVLEADNRPSSKASSDEINKTPVSGELSVFHLGDHTRYTGFTQ